jgi:ComF family protein
MNIFYYLRDFFFPSGCALCGASCVDAEEIRYGLCKPCRLSIAFNTDKKCNECGKPLISENDTCLGCRDTKNKPFERLWVLFPYSGKYRKLLSAYKFKKRLPLANFFAEIIVQLMKTEPELRNAVIVPVPPRPGKIKKTGWDQVDYLVKKIREQSEPRPFGIARCLKRIKSQIQKKLTREERRENLQGRIFCKSTPPKIALIIDDVITTGSTIEVCASALKSAGTQKVYSICLFYD